MNAIGLASRGDVHLTQPFGGGLRPWRHGSTIVLVLAIIGGRIDERYVLWRHLVFLRTWHACVRPPRLLLLLLQVDGRGMTLAATFADRVP